MMKRKKTINDLLKDKKKEEKLKKKFNLKESEQIVIENKNTLVQILKAVVEIFFKISKVLFIILITILSTIGLTVILNEVTRTEFINLMNNAIN
ncbi:MAG: hypothetical protein IJJ82_07795 [Clostridia bacterium]|nr:hypothetical protein [Clostridia bacterium]